MLKIQKQIKQNNLHNYSEHWTVHGRSLHISLIAIENNIQLSTLPCGTSSSIVFSVHRMWQLPTLVFLFVIKFCIPYRWRFFQEFLSSMLYRRPFVGRRKWLWNVFHCAKSFLLLYPEIQDYLWCFWQVEIQIVFQRSNYLIPKTKWIWHLLPFPWYSPCIEPRKWDVYCWRLTDLYLVYESLSLQWVGYTSFAENSII